MGMGPDLQPTVNYLGAAKAKADITGQEGYSPIMDYLWQNGIESPNGYKQAYSPEYWQNTANDYYGSQKTALDSAYTTAQDQLVKTLHGNNVYDDASISTAKAGLSDQYNSGLDRVTKNTATYIDGLNTTVGANQAGALGAVDANLQTENADPKNPAYWLAGVFNGVNPNRQQTDRIVSEIPGNAKKLAGTPGPSLGSLFTLPDADVGTGGGATASGGSSSGAGVYTTRRSTAVR